MIDEAEQRLHFRDRDRGAVLVDGGVRKLAGAVAANALTHQGGRLEDEGLADDGQQEPAAAAAREHGPVVARVDRRRRQRLAGVDDLAQAVEFVVAEARIEGELTDHVGCDVIGVVGGRVEQTAAGVGVIVGASDHAADIVAAGHVLGGDVEDGLRLLKRDAGPDLAIEVLHEAELPLPGPVEAHDVLRVDGERDVLLARCHADPVQREEGPGLTGKHVKAPIGTVERRIGLAETQGVAVALVAVRADAGREEVGLEVAGDAHDGRGRALDQEGQAALPGGAAELGLVIERRLLIGDRVVGAADVADDVAGAKDRLRGEEAAQGDRDAAELETSVLSEAGGLLSAEAAVRADPIGRNVLGRERARVISAVAAEAGRAGRTLEGLGAGGSADGERVGAAVGLARLLACLLRRLLGPLGLGMPGGEIVLHAGELGLQVLDLLLDGRDLIVGRLGRQGLAKQAAEGGRGKEAGSK